MWFLTQEELQIPHRRGTQTVGSVNGLHLGYKPPRVVSDHPKAPDHASNSPPTQGALSRWQGDAIFGASSARPPMPSIFLRQIASTVAAGLVAPALVRVVTEVGPFVATAVTLSPGSASDAVPALDDVLTVARPECPTGSMLSECVLW